MKRIVLSFALVMFFSTMTLAGVCEITIDRSACSEAQKEEMLKPYDKVNPTKETKSVADTAACQKFAKSKSEIIRTGVLGKKSVTATFDGKKVEGGPWVDDKMKECKK